jgi:hypothetical protein
MFNIAAMLPSTAMGNSFRLIMHTAPKIENKDMAKKSP